MQSIYIQENNLDRVIDTIYWVGGFGGCKYVRNQLEKHLETKFQGCTYQFPVPPEPELAVIRGAFRCDPRVIREGKLVNAKPDWGV